MPPRDPEVCCDSLVMLRVLPTGSVQGAPSPGRFARLEKRGVSGDSRRPSAMSSNAAMKHGMGTSARIRSVTCEAVCAAGYQQLWYASNCHGGAQRRDDVISPGTSWSRSWRPPAAEANFSPNASLPNDKRLFAGVSPWAAVTRIVVAKTLNAEPGAGNHRVRQAQMELGYRARAFRNLAMTLPSRKPTPTTLPSGSMTITGRLRSIGSRSNAARHWPSLHKSFSGGSAR